MPLIIAQAYRSQKLPLPENTFATGKDGVAFVSVMPLNGSANTDTWPIMAPAVVVMSLTGSANTDTWPIMAPAVVVMSLTGSAG